MINFIKIFLGIPALIVHELSHIFAILLLGAKGDGIEVNTNIEDFKVTVHYNTTSNWKKNVISMAPLLGFIVWTTILPLFSGLPLLLMIMYTIIYIRVFFPSGVDILTYKTPIDSFDENFIIPDYTNKKSES